jgi:hypothetical protein
MVYTGWLRDRDYMVEELVEQWYGPDRSFHKVRADDRNLYLARRHVSTGTSNVEAAGQPR